MSPQDIKLISPHFLWYTVHSPGDFHLFVICIQHTYSMYNSQWSHMKEEPVSTLKHNMNSAGVKTSNTNIQNMTPNKICVQNKSTSRKEKVKMYQTTQKIKTLTSKK